MQPQWAPDPTQRHFLRWWDGTAWTEHVSDGRWLGIDPVPHLTARSTPRSRRRRPHHDRTGRPNHATIALLTLGLWLFILPAVVLWRRGSHGASAFWVAGVAGLVIATTLTGVSGRVTTLQRPATATVAPAAEGGPALEPSVPRTGAPAAPPPAAAGSVDRPPADRPSHGTGAASSTGTTASAPDTTAGPPGAADPPVPTTAPPVPTTAPPGTTATPATSRAPAPRTTAPRTTAPRATASRTTAPRTTAPRTTAPRTTAPRTTAPRTTAPRSSAPPPRATASPTRTPRATSPATTTGAAPSARPPSVTTTTSAATRTLLGVRRGALCTEHGAFGITTDGLLVRCTTAPGDRSYRWRTV